MAVPLLRTKLHIPALRAKLVSRPHLTERLNAGTYRRLTLVSAPAGFGKTTLLSEWAHYRSEADPPLPVAWVSLNKGDNDPTRFWSYFIAALQTIYPTIGESALAALQSPRPVPIESILTSLSNDITEEIVKAQSCVIVLDDCHLIEARPIYDALAFLLDHLPPQMHLVIATRSDPPLPLSRLRGRGQLTELRTADLRFTYDEASAFLDQVMGLSLSAEDIAALETRTEGWIVGLQMAALAMRSLGSPRAFVTAFTGSHRYILDYLTDEVLLQQPQEVQNFLLQTSILDRLTGPLCGTVTGQGDAQEMLERLDIANLFIVPLDNERRWYRYHHLFTDLLRKRLRQTQPDQVPILHQRAGEWYEANGLIAEAIGHALASDDADRAAWLVERNALVMMDHGEVATLLEWLGALPVSVLSRHPWLCVAHAWALAYSGQLESVPVWLQNAEKALSDLDPDTVKAYHVAGHVATIQSYAAGLRGEYVHAVESARRALELLPDDDLSTRAFAASQLSFALRTTEGLEAATQAAIEAGAMSRAAGDSHVAVLVLCDLAGLLGLQGRLHEAADTYQDALRLTEEYARRSGRQLPAAGFVYGRISTVLRVWNDLEAAVRMARKGVELCRKWGRTESFVDCYFYLALALQAAGDEQGALDAMQEAKQAARQISPWYVSVMDRFEARIQLNQGDLASASRWAAAQETRFSIGDEPESKHVVEYLTVVRILIAQAWAQAGTECDRVDPIWDDKLEKALRSLTGLLQAAEAHNQIARATEIQIIQAMLLQALGRLEQALLVLGRVLSLTEPIGQIRAIVGKGAPMEKLLRQAIARGIIETSRVSWDYVNKLLAAFKQTTHSLPLSSSLADSLIEPLTERELEVLRLITAGLSNREIADELSLAVGTVKRHTNNIYGKLNVHKRTQAVACARELGLL